MIARCNRQSPISNPQCLPTLTKHCCVCGSEKLPFAGYSVVKDQPGDFVPPDPLATSLARPLAPRSAPSGARPRALKLQPGELRSARTPSTRSLVGTPRSPLRSRGRTRFRSRAWRPRDRLRLQPAHSRRAFVAPLRLRGRRRDRLKLSSPKLSDSPEIPRSICSGLPSRSSRRQPRAKAGGEYRARTGDLLVANQALSQLS